MLFSTRELTVVKQLQEGPCAMRGRRDFFRAAVMNLVINAVEHSPLGGELILQGSSSEEDGAFRLRVTDEGPGIATEVVEEIFVPEALPGLKAKGVRLGRGLGLVVARSAAERLGGNIQIVEPHHKRFATAVQLEIPASSFLSSLTADVAEEPEASWSAPIRLALHIEADGSNSDVFTTNLSHKGATLVWAGEDAFPEEGPLTISLAVSPQAKTQARFILRDGNSLEVEWSDPSEEFLQFMQEVHTSLS